MKMIWYRSNALGQPARKKIISRKRGYHGVTIASASLTGLPNNHLSFDLPIANVLHTSTPHHWRDAEPGESEEQFSSRLADDLEKLILAEGPETIAAFIGEPIMGAGGVKIPPMSYWPEVQRICRKYDVLLMLDEVITGYGRTGEWFAAQAFGVEPDTITTAKALTSGYQPLSAVLVGDRVSATLVEKGGEFHHGYTYAGHPVACAVALANLDVIEREGLVERVKNDTGPYFAKALRDRIAGHALVGEVRSFGLMGAIEIVRDKVTKERFEPALAAAVTVRDHAIANGLMMRATGDTMILSPPLIWTREIIDLACKRIAKALDLAEADLRRA
jgi:putrescine aminotransferase